MQTNTDSSRHDPSRDDVGSFRENFDDIYGKPWYERDEEEDLCT